LTAPFSFVERRVSNLLSLLAAYQPNQPAPGYFLDGTPMWIAVRRRFQLFHADLLLTDRQRQDGFTKARGVANCLNRNYYVASSDGANSFAAGSWGKNTMTRPPRDIDLFFVLPPAVYQRFEGYQFGRQSALLQEIKRVLQGTFPDTEMRGDGQVVVVRFESYGVEVVPAFLLQDGRYWICDTNDGGRYKVVDPWAEIRYVNWVDQQTNGNVRQLIRMLKAWQDYCSVPLKSFALELLAAEFLQQSPWRLRDFFWFDWILRDFFSFLLAHGSYVVMPGTSDLVNIGTEWASRAQSALGRAVKACDYEKDNLTISAGEEWQKIFGPQIPQYVS
jgi:hypothetical protein